MTLQDIHDQFVAVGKQLSQAAADMARQLDAFGKSFAASTAGLQAYIDQQQQPPGPPAPDPVKPVRFGRFLHAQDKTYSIAEQTQRWSLQVLQGDPWHLGQLAALKAAAPGMLLLRPSTSVARRWSDEPGDSVCLPPGRIPDEWMLTNKYGQIIKRVRDGDEFVDPGNLDYQREAGAFLVDVCRRQGWTRIWIDEINAKSPWSFGDNQGGDRARDMPTKYPTEYAYAVALRGFVKAVTKQLRAAGIQVWVNLAGQFDPKTGVWDAWTKGIAAETDGHCIEFFIGRGGEPTASLENGYWKPMLDWMQWQAGSPQLAMYNAQTRDPAVVRYALATYLLAADPESSVFMAGLDPYRVDETVWTDDMVLARKLGAPLGPYQEAGGLYSRRFANGGQVFVNPSQKAVGGMAGLTGAIMIGT